MLTNQSGWIAPLKQPFLAKSALYSILKQKVFKIWDISWEYSDTLVEFLDGLADKLKIKSFSKPKTLGKKKSPNCGTQFWSFFVQLKDFQVSFQHENTAPPFRISMKKDQNWVLQFGDFFLPRFLNKKHVFSSTFVLDGLSRATKVSLYSPQNSEYRCNYRARIAWNHSCNQVYSTIFVSKMIKHEWELPTAPVLSALTGSDPIFDGFWAWRSLEASHLLTIFFLKLRYRILEWWTRYGCRTSGDKNEE